MNKIELLNSEGPILIAEKLNDETFVLNFTQENYQIEVSHNELTSFIEGKTDIGTPSGKIYNYPSFPEDMKTSYKKFCDFTRKSIQPIVYLASPYSHPDKEIEEARFKLISKIAANLNAEGIVAFSPITYGHTLLNYEELPTNWQFWQTFCLSFLQHVDELWVYMMEGWESSNGVRSEIEYAEVNDIKVVYKDVPKTYFTVTREKVEDLQHLGIDAEEELRKILEEEIKKSFLITKEKLLENGWEEFHSPFTGKIEIGKQPVKNDFDKYDYYFTFDLETMKLRVHGGEFSNLVTNKIETIVDLNVLTNLLKK